MIIFLIGFMGSGKSTIGVKLAKKLEFSFIDTDNLIESEEGIEVSEIFETKGEEYFRERETEIISKLSMKKNLVVSLGGGSPCYNNNINSINISGTSFFLDVSVSNLIKRLENGVDQRPLLSSLNKDEIVNYIKTKLKERIPFYKQAIHIVDSNRDANSIVEDIYKKIKENVRN